MLQIVSTTGMNAQPVEENVSQDNSLVSHLESIKAYGLHPIWDPQNIEVSIYPSIKEDILTRIEGCFNKIGTSYSIVKDTCQHEVKFKFDKPADRAEAIAAFVKVYGWKFEEWQTSESNSLNLSVRQTKKLSGFYYESAFCDAMQTLMKRKTS